MPPKPRSPFLIAATIAILLLHARSAVSQTAGPVIENVRAFAKLYGYVRWFHPSDEASAIDWDKPCCLLGLGLFQFLPRVLQLLWRRVPSG